MRSLVATFVSHFGAVRFQKQCAALGWQARLMPVPRSLSSSCGTCVSYQAPEGELMPPDAHEDELECVAEESASGYVTVWEAE
jgi:hypothetical protein